MWLGNIIAVGLALLFGIGLNFHWLVAWLVSVNLIAFVVYFLDKQFAKRRRRRISEADLLYYTLIGGTVGATLGMKVFRHKTQKKTFRRWYWGIVALQGLLLGIWLWASFR